MLLARSILLPMFAFSIAGGLPSQAVPTGVPAWIDAGPMIGHVGPNSVEIWVRHEKKVNLAVRGSLKSGGELLAVLPRMEKLGDRIKRYRFFNLLPDSDLTVQLYEEPWPTRGVAFVVRTSPKPELTGRLRIGFGSGLNDILAPKGRALSAAARSNPDLFLFAGNSTYYVREYEVERVKKSGRKKKETRIDVASGDGDWTGRKRMLDRQLRTRKNDGLQALLRSVPCYAVWGTHDFGPLGADRTFSGRKDALHVFRQMWANPGFGTAATAGCFSSFRRGPVEFFLVDDSYHRRIKNSRGQALPAAEQAIWGKAQFEWLCAGLRRSSAPVKVIVKGSPFLDRRPQAAGHGQEAPGESAALLAFLAEHKIGSVVFLSGGGLRSEMREVRLPSGSVLLECTAAPLAGDLPKKPQLPAPVSSTRWRAAEESFGLLTVDIPTAGKGRLTFELRDRKGKLVETAGVRCQSSWVLPLQPR